MEEIYPFNEHDKTMFYTTTLYHNHLLFFCLWHFFLPKKTILTKLNINITLILT